MHPDDPVLPALPVAAASSGADDIATVPVTPLLTTTTKPRLTRGQLALSIGGHLVFWPFNLLFASLALLGYAPLILAALLADAFAGLTPWPFAIGAVLLALVPVASSIGGVFLTIRKDGRALLMLLLGVEIPAIWLLATRTFGMQELTGSAALLIVAGVVGLAGLYVRMLRGNDDRALLLTQPLVAVLVPVGAWVVVVMGSIAAPSLLDLLGDLVMPDGTFELQRALFGVLVWTSAITFFATPVLGPVVWGMAAIGGARTLWRRRGPAVAVATTVGPMVAVIVALAVLWTSPALTTLARLKTLPTTDVERQQLLDDREDIRAGLIDAALVRHRYLVMQHDKPWQHAWHRLLGEDVAGIVDSELRLWAGPFVFEGDPDDAQTEASRLYRAFFGEELERAERDAVVQAMASTFTREQRFAGLINEGQQRVRLVHQQVTATPTDAGFVAVEIHDEWSNLTPTDLEIQLSFSLPPSSAITGLWLNDVDDKASAFPFALAPRGAAQQVYREQVAARVDPALLEQVGPQQYRLRVFPVPARAIDDEARTMIGWRNRDAWSSTAGKHAHVWLTYETIAVDGVVPVPRLLEARNAFFDDVAIREVQGKRVANSDTQWLAAAPVVSTTTTPTAQTFRLADGSCVDVKTQPTTTTAPTLAGLAGKRVDVVLDRSLAMASTVPTLSTALLALAASGAVLETVMTSGALRNEDPSRIVGVPAVTDQLPFLAFGTTSLKQMLQQQQAVVRLDGGAADVVVLLAARGSLESSDDTPLVMPAMRPVIAVLHLSELPSGYDDATADAVSQSGGIITTSLTEVAAHLEQGEALLVDNVVMREAPCTPQATAAPATVARLAVRLLDRRRDRSDASALDRLHAIAMQVAVVTPYSSMIVLVSEAQRERLRQLNARADRYDREVEDGAQHATNGPTFLVSGAPEPQEWLLLLVAMLAVVLWRRHHAAPQR